MIMPYIEEQQTSVDMVSTFAGYNHNPVIEDGSHPKRKYMEFFDMENMTGDRYPLASVRDKRGTLDVELRDGEEIVGVAGKDNMCVIYKTHVDSDMPGYVDYFLCDDGYSEDESEYFFLKVPITLDSNLTHDELPRRWKSAYNAHTDDQGRYVYGFAEAPIYTYKDTTPTDTYAVSPGRFLTMEFIRSGGSGTAYYTPRKINYIENGHAFYKCPTRAGNLGTDYLSDIGAGKVRIRAVTPAMLTETQFNNARRTTAQTSITIDNVEFPVYKDAFGDGSILLGNKRYTNYEAYRSDMVAEGLSDAYKITIEAKGSEWEFDLNDESTHRLLTNKSLESVNSTTTFSTGASYYNSSGILTNTQGNFDNAWVDVDGVIHYTFGNEEDENFGGFVHAVYHTYNTQWLKGKSIYIGTRPANDDHFAVLGNKITVLAVTNARNYTYDSNGVRHLSYKFSKNGEWVTVSGYNSRTDHTNVYREFDIYVSKADAESIITLGTSQKSLKTMDNQAALDLNEHHGVIENQVVSDKLAVYLAVGTKASTSHSATESSYTIEHGDFLRVLQYNPTTREKSYDTKVCNYVSGDHNLIEMGANLIVLPEKYRINTIKKGDYYFSEIVSLETTFEGTANISWNMTVGTTSSSPPSNPESYSSLSSVWWDSTNKVAKVYSKQSNMWATKNVTKTITFSNPSTNPGFKEGDAVRFAGDTNNYLIKSVTNSSITIETTEKPTGSSTGETVTITRLMPEMDYVIECQNRLWGCRYGEANNGQTVNEIFASKLGDPSNWYSFANTASDSYYVNLGDKGAFTGAVKYQDNPVFFRADKIHRITGSYPANYQVKNIDGYGVKPGCHKSITVMNDIVYYLSPMGMVVYNGGIPVSIAEPFGEVKYKKCISGDIGNKLYCSMQDENDNWTLFVYDDSKGFWHKEDNLQALGFCNYSDELFLYNDTSLVSLSGVYGTKENDLEWTIRSGEIGYNSPMRKRLLKVVMRLVLGITSRARIEIQYDNDGIWRFINELRPKGKMASYAVPVSPYRCDHFSIRIRGKGQFSLQSMTKFWSEGSEYD